MRKIIQLYVGLGLGFTVVFVIFLYGCNKGPTEEVSNSSGAVESVKPVNFELDHLPKIVGRRIYSDSGKFSFELPKGWRIEPIPIHLWKKQIAAKREEMLLRPILASSAFPNIRITRMQGLVFKPELFATDKHGAAIHMLDQFFGGKWKKRILSDPVLDLKDRRFSFVFKIAPMMNWTVEAHFFFRKDYTLMIAGTFVSDERKLSNQPLSYIIRTLKFYSD